ncbi:MAG: Thiol-disulfide oxidoreductase ResA [Planctomycetota bacterium]|jgi:tetratricopeptide (TPR) repeat protein
MFGTTSVRLLLAAGLFLLATTPAYAQQRAVSAEQLLKTYAPIQKGVEYDTPKPEDFAKCRLVQEKNSFVIYGPANEPLRRFTDANGDGPPDVYHYYRLGLEVYREIDTNGDHKAKRNTRPDQFRWLNWGGTRWGVDANEDGRIESWKMISAQEAARVAVEALINGDLAALESVMISDAEIQSLRVPAAMAKQLQDSVAELPRKAQTALAGGRILNSKSTWVRFDAALPGLVPAEQSGAAQDLMVFENAMAYVQNGEKLELISIGEMVQAGNSWKLVSVPTPLDTSGTAVVALGGILMQTGMGAGAPAAGEMSPEMQRLLADLQKLDESSPQADATAQVLANYNVARANLAEKLVGQARTDDERAQWIQQFTDSLSTATQSGLYQEGLARLQKLETAVRPNPALHGYVFYRRLMAEYAVRLKEDDKATDEANARTAREATQKWWFEQLEAFARQWPNSDDAPDAVVQLAISYELMGRIDDAKAWYGQLAKNYPETDGGIKATGALRRLSLLGNPLQLAGRNLQNQPLSAAQYRGKVLLVVFWASYAQPFVDDLESIQATFAKHQKAGFEILGVNLDPDANAASAFLTKSGVRWQNLRDAAAQPGAQPGDFGFGIVSLPTMFLVNREGVVEGGITAKNLDIAVDALLQGKKLESLRPADEANPAAAEPPGGSARAAGRPAQKE